MYRMSAELKNAVLPRPVKVVSFHTNNTGNNICTNFAGKKKTFKRLLPALALTYKYTLLITYRIYNFPTIRTTFLPLKSE